MMGAPGRMRSAVYRCRQRGVAVITALLLTTLAITIVASLFWQQQVQVRSIENQRLQLQKQWILRGALDWASLILRADANTSQADHLGEPWAVPLADTRLDQYVENGRADSDASEATLSGGIIDAQSRFNLNDLVSGTGQVDMVQVALFQNLLSELRLNPSLAEAAAKAIAASRPIPLASGAVPQQAQQQQSQQTSGPRPMKIEFLEDLLSVPGFTPEIIAKLRDFAIVLPGLTAINVNTAPVEVLAAKLATIDSLSAADAATLVSARESAYFKDVGDIKLRLNKELSMTASFGPSKLDDLSVSTNYFLVNGKVRMSRAALEVQALIRRDGGTTRIIWIRQT